MQINEQIILNSEGQNEYHFVSFLENRKKQMLSNSF